MADDVSDKELWKLYQCRLKDRNQSRTRRRKQIEKAPRPFSDLLAQFFQKDADAMRRIEENRAISAWAVCVGESAAQVSEALRLRNHTLIVYVQDPLWMQQLSLLKREILKKYRESFPRLQIRDIFFTRNKGAISFAG